MAMKVVHRAMFFRNTEDIRLNHAFILRWCVDEEKGCGEFIIEMRISREWSECWN